MKHLLFIIAIFCAFASFAQAPTFDTVYTKQVSANFYEVKRYEWADGRYNESGTLLGDSLQTFTVMRDRYAQRAKDMAIEVQSIVTFPKELTAIRRESDRVETLTGRNPLDSLQAQNLEYFTGNTWVIRGDTSQNISFNQTAAGQFRYRVNNGTNRNAVIYGKSIVLLTAYPKTGQNTILYNNASGRFITTNNRLRIQKANETARK